MTFSKKSQKGLLNALTEAVKSAILDVEQPKKYSDRQIPETVEGSDDNKERVKAIIAALVDSNTSLEEPTNQRAVRRMNVIGLGFAKVYIYSPSFTFKLGL